MIPVTIHVTIHVTVHQNKHNRILNMYNDNSTCRELNRITHNKKLITCTMMTIISYLLSLLLVEEEEKEFELFWWVPGRGSGSSINPNMSRVGSMSSYDTTLLVPGLEKKEDSRDDSLLKGRTAATAVTAVTATSELVREMLPEENKDNKKKRVICVSGYQ